MLRDASCTAFQSSETLHGHTIEYFVSSVCLRINGTSYLFGRFKTMDLVRSLEDDAAIVIVAFSNTAAILLASRSQSSRLSCMMHNVSIHKNLMSKLKAIFAASWKTMGNVQGYAPTSAVKQYPLLLFCNHGLPRHRIRLRTYRASQVLAR